MILGIIRVDFGLSGARPVTGQSRKSRLSNLPVEGIAIAQQIQARNTHYESRDGRKVPILLQKSVETGREP
jgi:hypothetical protein